MAGQLGLLTSGPTPEDAIQSIVASNVAGFAADFSNRHILARADPEGTINAKIYNVFLAELSQEVQYYSALARSFDSSFGNMLEAMAIQIAMLFYDVEREVQGPLSDDQTRGIATLLERYKRNAQRPDVADYQFLRVGLTEAVEVKRHASDYYLTDRDTGDRYLVELKIGGDLDNKKARSEKEALLEQFAILSNTLPRETIIRIFFATAYNRFGEGRPWNQGRVRQFFAAEELLISANFWNFVCKRDDGAALVMAAYRENAHLIRDALAAIRHAYLG